MKLWLLEQSECRGYDTYSDCVVVADTEELAKDMHPCQSYPKFLSEKNFYCDWALEASDITATLLGDAIDPTRRVVCSSFHAG
jgi:hypothetical protein